MNHVLITPQAKPAPDASGWEVRLDDGSIVGPVGLDTLSQWAAEGRLTASCSLSQDGGANWIAAASMPELEMDWLVLLSAESVIGPFNFAAVEALREAGEIPAGAQLFRRHVAGAASSQGMQLVQRTVAAEARWRQAETELQQLRADLEAQKLEFEAERQQAAAEVARGKAELLRREAELESLQQAREQWTANSEERQGLEARLVDSEREAARLRDESSSLRHRLAVLTEERAAAESRREASQERLRSQLATVVQQAQDIRARYEERTARFAALADSLRELTAGDDLPEMVAPEVAEEAEISAEMETKSSTTAKKVPADRKTPPQKSAPKAASENETPDQETDAAPREFRRQSAAAAGRRKAAEEPEVAEVEVISPARNTTGSTTPGTNARRLADLEAQAQREMAMLNSIKGEGVSFWKRGK